MLLECGIMDSCHNHNIFTDKWIVKFYDDNEMTEVTFSDEQGRVINYHFNCSSRIIILSQ